MNNAKENGLPLFMTFLDLANAFGSISHRLIQDMLSYVAVPDQVTKYICDAYSKLRGFVSSSSWTTEFFPIERGVFQGDTLSPLIFLIAFNPIIELANTSKSSGFSLKYPVPSSCGLPPVDAHIYLKWDEPSSDEAPGWYRCQVAKYLPNGLTEVHYPNGTLGSGMCDEATDSAVMEQLIIYIRYVCGLTIMAISECCIHDFSTLGILFY